MSKDINVLMIVDTINIDSNNINKTVVLVDDNLDHDTTPDDSSTFTINCEDDDKITFRTIGVNGAMNISFVAFKWENEAGSSHCFNPLPMASNGWTGIVSGDPGDHENFSITFSVIDDNGEVRCYTLDPKLVIKQGGGD